MRDRSFRKDQTADRSRTERACNIKEIAAINNRYLNDFKDVDLYWAPDRKTGAPKTAAPRQQPAYTPPAPAYNYQENDPIYDEELIS